MTDPIEPAVATILAQLGEDPQREGLLQTPSRVARSMRFFTRGYAQDPAEIIGGALFKEDYEEMIVMKDIDFFSLCEHHLLPFFGKAHVAYIPAGRIVGISKIARLVEVFARRLQVQERLTKQVAQTMMEQLEPAGVAVVVEAEHLCMRMRGVEKQNSIVVSSAVLGVFRTSQETREEFMSLVHNGLRR
jgi:GTP cyclohydrolase I